MIDCHSCGQRFFGALKPDGRCPACNGFPGGPVSAQEVPTENSAIVTPPNSVPSMAVRIISLSDKQKPPGQIHAILEMDGEKMVLRYRAKRGGFFSRHFEDIQVAIPLAEIVNVHAWGRNMRFNRVGPGGPFPNTVLITEKPQDAANLAAALPRVDTPDFAETTRAMQTMGARLLQTTPRTYITQAVVIVNVLLFVVMCFAGPGWSGRTAQSMYAWGGNLGPVTSEGAWWRLLSSAFLHWDAAHLLFNMWALYSAGILAERLFGNGFFGLIYLFGATTAGLASVWWHENTCSAGASGAVFAVYGAILAFAFVQRGSLPAGAMRSMAKSAGAFVFYNVLLGAMHPFIDNAAHLGGLFGGFALGAILARPFDPRSRERQMMPRLMASLLFAGVVIGASIFNHAGRSLLWTGDYAFGEAAQAAAGPEKSVSDQTNDLWQRYSAGNVAPEVMLEQLQRAADTFDMFARRLSAVNLDERSDRRRLRDLLVESRQIRRDSLLALRDGVKNNDAGKMSEAAALRDKAEKLDARIQLQSGGIK